MSNTTKAGLPNWSQLFFHGEVYRTAFAASDIGAFRCSFQNGRMDWDETMYRLFGIPAKQRLRHFEEALQFVHPQDQSKVRAAAQAAKQADEKVEVRFRCRWPDHSSHWLLAQGKRFYNSAGAPWFVVGTCQEITQQVKAEESLRRSGQILQRVTEAASVLISYLDRELRFQYVSAGYGKWFQRPLEDIQGRHMREILGETAFAAVEKYVRQALAGREVVYTQELPYQEIGPRYVHVQYIPDIDEGNVLGFSVIVIDLTESRKLSERAAQLSAIVESSTDAILSQDINGIIQSWNRGAERLFGYKAEEMIDRPITLLIPSHRMEEEFQMLERIRLGEWVAPYETARLRKDGSEAAISLTISPLFDSQGHLIGASKIARDISERKCMEDALRESMAREQAKAAELRALLEAVPAGVYIAEDPNGHVITTNLAGHKLLNRPPGKNISKTPANTVRPPREGAEIPPEVVPLKRAAQGEEIRNYELDLEWEDGSRHHLVGNAVPLPGAQGRPRGAVGAFIDITERKRAEAALREKEEHLSMALMASGTGTYRWDIQANKIQWSEGLERLCGLAAGAGKMYSTLECWLSLIHPDDRPHFLSAIKDCMGKGMDLDTEYRIVVSDGSVHWLANKGKVFFDAAARPLYMTGACVDITEHKRQQTQLRQQAELLTEADRRKDEFLATLAHELRNPLAPIANSLQILKRVGSNPQALAKAVSVSERQLQHLVRLVEDLLDVSRITQGKIQLRKEQVVLDAVIKNALEISRPHIEAGGHTLSVDIPEQPVSLQADLTRLAQAVSNLLINAAKYTPSGGRIRLTARRQNQEVAIAVQDNGTGIATDLLPRIFDMFVQAERSGGYAPGGLGIGLPLVKGLVELHGGQVETASPGLGQGSTFTIRLPLDLGGMTKTPVPDSPMETSGETKAHRILVVDDNVDAADSMAEVLRVLGYHARTAYTGKEALEAAREYAPGVVLLDLGMPGMNGYEVAERLRQLPRQERPILIALTGWGQEADRQRTRAAGFDDHLIKPVDLQTLTRALNAYPSSST